MTDPSDTQIDSPLEEELTQLISYLDGEMDDGQMTEIESRLISNPAMRSHADILSKTWSLLDELDDVPVSDTFTKQTMASIATESIPADGQPGQTRFGFTFLSFLVAHKIIPAFLIGLVAGGVGLFLSSNIQEQTGELELDRMVIDNIDFLPDAGLYEVVPSAEILKSLQLPGDSSETNE